MAVITSIDTRIKEQLFKQVKATAGSLYPVKAVLFYLSDLSTLDNDIIPEDTPKKEMVCSATKIDDSKLLITINKLLGTNFEYNTVHILNSDGELLMIAKCATILEVDINIEIILTVSEIEDVRVTL